MMNEIVSTLVPLPISNVDTDQIIPARFLKATTRDGFAEGLFYNWRYLPGGQVNPDFVLNQPAFQGEVLVAGNNFGCGSSREHAAWALADYGFKAILSSQFADIFKGNALKNGILPVELAPAEIEAILACASANPGTQIHIDLAAQSLEVAEMDLCTDFQIHPFQKHCLMHGIDETGFLIGMKQEIFEFDQSNRKRIPIA